MSLRTYTGDAIVLRDMEMECVVGVLPFERTRRRKINVSIRLECDLKEAGQTDSIGATVDYRTVQEKAEEAVRNSSDGLIERLAQRIADAVLEIPGARAVTVTLDKPGALSRCRAASVEITRSRSMCTNPRVAPDVELDLARAEIAGLDHLIATPATTAKDCGNGTTALDSLSVYFKLCHPALWRGGLSGLVRKSSSPIAAILLRRILCGVRIADAKFRKDPNLFIRIVRNSDRNALLEALTVPNVEEAVLARAEAWRGGTASDGRACRTLFKRLMFLTKKLEVETIHTLVLPPPQIDAAPAAIAGLCRALGWKLATAESCTGGMIAASLTDVPGISDVFNGSVVSYANSVKQNVLGVPASVLDSVGAVSAETASAMAIGACAALNTGTALSVTGIAGPSGDSAKKPVGTVYFAVSRPGSTGIRLCRWDGKTLNRDGMRVAARNQAFIFWLGELAAATFDGETVP